MKPERLQAFLEAHGWREYPFPLSDGSLATLRLPGELTAEDAERLAAYVQTLVYENAFQPGRAPVQVEPPPLKEEG